MISKKRHNKIRKHHLKEDINDINVIRDMFELGYRIGLN